MAKYYIIEKWTEYEDRPFSGSYTMFDVREFSTKSQLENAILKGSKHGGEIIAAQGLEIKLSIEEQKEDHQKHTTDRKGNWR